MKRFSWEINWIQLNFGSHKPFGTLAHVNPWNQLHHAIGASRHQRSWEAKEDVVRMCQK